MADYLKLNALQEAIMGRRDLLKRATVLGMSATGFGALLAACGGDDDDDEPEATSPPASDEPTATTAEEEPEDEETPADEETPEGESEETPEGEAEETPEGEETETTEEPTTGTGGGDGQRGGTFQGYETTGPESLDPYISGGQPQSLWSAYTYSMMFMLESGPGVPQGSQETIPDVAASIEVSEDGMTYTTPLKDNVMFHPPLSRPLTAQDILFSWEYGSNPETAAGDRLTGRGLGEYVVSLEAPDDLTVVWNLNAPYPFFTQLLADPKQFFIIAQEAGTDFNPAEQAIGTGPWVLEEFQPDTIGRFVRFDDWHHGPERPYYDNVNLNIIPEYATQLAQFLGGNLDMLILNSQDLARVQNEIEGVQIYQRGAYPVSVLNFSPREDFWSDVRLRRAVSMAIDRDAMLDAAYGLRELESAGIEVQRNWHNNVPVAFSEYWLDPKGDRISEEAAANFRYDPEAARALVEEAGGAFDTELHYAAAGSRYGEPYRIMSELMIGYLNEVGIRAVAVEEDYNTEFLGTDGTSGGNFNGLMWIAQTRLEPFQYLATQITDNPEEVMYARWSSEDWHADLMARKDEIQRMTDTADLQEAILDIQEEMNKLMFVVPMQWSAFGTYVAYQPWVENALDYQSFTQNAAVEALTYYWSSQDS